MAAEAKKGGVKHHAKSSSAPATPQRPGGEPQQPEKPPVPSYLRQTISSCRNTASRRRQSPPPPATAAKSLKERSSAAPKPSNATKAKARKEASHSKPPMLSKSQSFSRVTSATAAGRTKRTEAKQEEKGNANREAAESKRKPGNGNGEKMTTGRKDNAGSAKPRGPPRAKDFTSSSGSGGGVVRLQAGNVGKRVVPKRPSEHYNEVIEETAERKNKVLALVGAFETVISSQEPEGQPSPCKVDPTREKEEGEEEEEVVVNQLDCGNNDRGGEEINIDVGEIVDQNIEEIMFDDDRIQIQNRTDEKKEVQVDEPQKEKEKEISQLGQEKDEEVEEEKVENKTKSTTEVKECYGVGRESQQQHGEDNNHEEMESTESTEELTESTKEERKGSDLTVPTTEEGKNAEESKLEV